MTCESNYGDQELETEGFGYVEKYEEQFEELKTKVDVHNEVMIS